MLALCFLRDVNIRIVWCVFTSIILLAIGCRNPDNAVATPEKDLAKQDTIIQKYLVDSARQYSYYSKEWQKYIDLGLEKDSTIAYLWQQKAMPLFKQGKYELGMTYLDKAVLYDPESWLGYRAFIKCIFAKRYRAAIVDFEECLHRDGNSHVMDHSYRFYMALSLLQLNEFERSEKLFKEEIDEMFHERGEEWVHHLELFYYGISLYEQSKHHEAIEAFNRALSKYPQFSDVKYYKAIALAHLGNTDEAAALLDEAKSDRRDGYTITEDNAIYERYPYQLRWDQHGLHQ